MRPSRTTIPAILDAVYAATSTVMGPNVTVLDGPRAAQELQDDVVIIGATADGGNSIIVTTERSPGLGNRPTDRFAIWCIVSAWRGDGDIKACRDRCGELLGDLEEYWLAHRRIDGVADELQLGERNDWGQNQNKEGAVVAAVFQITGRAFR